MKRIDPKELHVRELYHYLTGGITPRPIAFASTVDKDGNPNLAPFSYFNMFSVNPPILIFSPNRRARNNTTKNTLDNVHLVKEVVINLVSFDIVRQMSIAGIEYPADVNEFEKAGFTMQPSEKIRPYRVKESPVQFECKVNEIIKLGEQGGAGNLVICEIVLMHINEAVLDDNGKIDPNKLDLCARLGGSDYVRVSGDNIFKINQPATELGIGFDNLPDAIKQSNVLTGNNLAELASLTVLPGNEEVKAYLSGDTKLQEIINDEMKVHQHAKDFLNLEDRTTAIKILLASILQ